jgi:hypothetical protein
MNAVMPRLPFAGIRRREDDHDVRDRRVGDEVLRAVEHPAATVLDGARALRLRVGASLRFGQRETADHLARRELGQPARALGVVALAEDRRAHQRALHRHRDRRRRAGARDLLQRDRVRQGVHPGAAPAFGDHRAKQSELAELREDLRRELVAAVDLGRARQDLARRQVARGVLNQLLLGRQIEVHAPFQVGGRFSTNARIPSF